MYSILKTVEEDARSYFDAFGFKEEEINSLITLGKQDLLKELKKLHPLLQASLFDIEEINNRLHAIKGLVSQLGSPELSSKINELRNDLGDKENIENITQLFFSKEVI